ncbi:MAG: GNAT family N-acetyltransferase [Deltaproteobacteria bacterium]|nr:GNAT family N-acetyltransferase [Deltaproteobacteria bacterium]
MKSNPDQYEISTITKGGLEVFIRPIRADDTPLLEALFDALSPKSVYFRFFMRIKRPSKEMLAKLMEIDHGRDAVLIATEQKEGRERILGVFRLMCYPDRKEGEFSLLVGDPWQGKGVGAKLLEHGLSIAKKRGMESVFGMALPENKTMLALARKRGFAITWDSDVCAYEMTINLTRINRN